MKDFYYKKLQESTLKLELARLGYRSKIKVLASKLAKQDDSLHDPILEAIKEMRTALAEMVEDALYYKGKYQEECEKEGVNGARDSE